MLVNVPITQQSFIEMDTKTRPEQWQLVMDMLTWKKKILQDPTPREITTTN